MSCVHHPANRMNIQLFKIIVKYRFNIDDALYSGSDIIVSVSNMFDFVRLKHRICYNQTIGTYKSVDAGTDAKSGTSVVTVKEQEFYGVLFGVKKIIKVSEADKVSLVAFLVQVSDIGFLYRYGMPSMLCDLSDDIDGWYEMVFIGYFKMGFFRKECRCLFHKLCMG